MHWFHDRENNFPICFPCARTIHAGCFFQCQRDICKISGIKQYIHRHIEYNIQNNNSCPVCQSHLCSLFYNRHHQNRKWNKHSADYIEINEFVKFTLFISSDCISEKRMNQNRKYNCYKRDKHAVSKRMPEICHSHCLSKIIQAEMTWQRKDSADTVCHLRRLFQCNYDCHVQWKCNCDQTK